jgi:hypothetical protein
VHVRSLDNLDRVPAARLEKDRKLLGELGGTFLEVRAGDVAQPSTLQTRTLPPNCAAERK